jgi:hypothetical protein
MNELVRFLPDRIPVLVMDDDDAVIQVIRLVFSRFRFESDTLELTH